MDHITQFTRDADEYIRRKDEYFLRVFRVITTVFGIIHGASISYDTDNPWTVCSNMLGGMFVGYAISPYYKTVVPFCSAFYLYRVFTFRGNLRP